MENPLTKMSAKARYRIYVVYFLALLVHGALAVWFDPDPEQVKKAGDVLQYLGGALALTAASNITRASRPKPTVKDNPLRGDDNQHLGQRVEPYIEDVQGRHERKAEDGRLTPRGLFLIALVGLVVLVLLAYGAR